MKRIICNPDTPHAAALLASLHDTFDRSGTTLHEGRNTVKAIAYGGRSYVVKRFRHNGWLKQIVYSIRKSKARRAYDNSMDFLAAGLNTPRPVGYVELGRRHGVADAYYVCEQCPMPDARCLEHAGHDAKMMSRLMSVVAQMHSKGIVHGDLNLSNILYSEDRESGGYRFTFIDTNRAKTKNRLSRKDCLTDLMRMSDVRPALHAMAAEYAAQRGWDPVLTAKTALDILRRFKDSKRLRRHGVIQYLYYRFSTGKPTHGMQRFINRLTVNIMVHLLRHTPTSEQAHGSLDNDDTIIVSLTSYRLRVPQLWKVIVPLLRQHTPYNYRVILWLSKEEYSGCDELPPSLQRLTADGLVIRFMDDNLRPHKKYLYSFREYAGHKIITVDDDMLYPLSLVDTLAKASAYYGDAVCCLRGRRIQYTPQGTRRRYEEWKRLEMSPVSTRLCDFIPTGVGGVLYPPHCYDSRVDDVETIKNTCLNADDLWLNLMCRLKNTPIVHVGNRMRYNTPLPRNNDSLSRHNVVGSGNEEAMARIDAWAREQGIADGFFHNMTAGDDKL